MEIEVKAANYETFQIRSDITRKLALDDPREHFYREIKARGGRIVDSFYETTQEEIDAVETLLKAKQKAIHHANRAEHQANLEFIKNCAELVFKGNQPTLKTIETLEAFSWEEHDKFFNTFLTQQQAIELEKRYRGDKSEPLPDEMTQMIDAAITADLLVAVNQACGLISSEGNVRGGFPIFSLVDLCLDPNDTWEVFLNGTSQTERWEQWVDANEQRLAKDKLIHRSKGGKKGLLLNQLQQFGDLFGFDVETVAKVKEEIPRRERIIKHHKGKATRFPNKVAEQKIRLRREITPQAKAAGKLSPMEERYYETIGDRAILKRRKVIPLGVYADLIKKQDFLLFDRDGDRGFV